MISKTFCYSKGLYYAFIEKMLYLDLPKVERREISKTNEIPCKTSVNEQHRYIILCYTHPFDDGVICFLKMLQ